MARVVVFYFSVLFSIVLAGHPHNIAWSGGPLHLECEHSGFLTHFGHYLRENVIVVKAASYQERIYVISPRWKPGILGTVWQIVHGRHGVELEAFPDERSHIVGDCSAIQNAVDFHLDHLGNIWVLDSGVVETLVKPRCTCPPKVVVINIARKKLTRHIQLTSVEPTSLLQNIVVEYNFGKAFVFISDASRGAIIVHDDSSDAQWSVIVCGPTMGLQLTLVKRGPAHAMLVIARLQHSGVIEMNTATLKRGNALSSITVFGEHSKPVVLLGSDSHNVYLRHSGCADVLKWNTRDPFNSSHLQNIHSPGPRLTPTSVSSPPIKHVLLGNIWVLDSGVVETLVKPRCTCPPKVVVINIARKKLTRHIQLTSVEPTSLLQNIVVEYNFGKAFVFISDASRGAIIVHDDSSDAQWSVIVCGPTMGLQLTLVKRGPAHAMLVIARLQHSGVIEMNTATLKRGNALSSITVFGEHSKPVVLLGSDSHNVYLRHSGCADVLKWNTRDPFNSSHLQNIHSPGPRLTPTSVSSPPIKHVLLGNIWVLDSGVVETLVKPRCTCPPKVVVINIARKKLTRHIQLTSVEPTSLLQNIVVEYNFGKAFVFISDASRGAIIVHDDSSDAQWSVIVCGPTMGLQLTLVKRGPAHAMLVIARLQHSGVIEMNTATLKRGNALSSITVFGEHSKPVVLLGSDSHNVYLRHSGCADVLKWNTRDPFNSSHLQNIHSPGPRLTPTSVSSPPIKHVLLVLDSNYADTVNSNVATYHRITFIDQW